MRIKGKKGIMVKFLVTTILAIIIFVPACLFASNFFRLSSQAKNNFGDFVKEINNLAEKGKEGEVRSFMLIMDDKTAIVGFNEGQKEVLSCFKNLVTNYEECGKWKTPDAEECKEGSCVCLIKEIVPLSEKTKKGFPGRLEVEYKSIACKKTENIIFDTPHYKKGDDENYNKGGFVLVRGVEFVYHVIKMFDFEFRRNQIFLMKKEGKIFVCWEGKCESVTEAAEKPAVPPPPGFK